MCYSVIIDISRSMEVYDTELQYTHTHTLGYEIELKSKARQGVLLGLLGVEVGVCEEVVVLLDRLPAGLVVLDRDPALPSSALFVCDRRCRASVRAHVFSLCSVAPDGTMRERLLGRDSGNRFLYPFQLGRGGRMAARRRRRSWQEDRMAAVY